MMKNWTMLLTIMLLLALWAASLVACTNAEKTGQKMQDSGQSVSDFASDNPGVDVITGNSVTLMAAMLVTVGSLIKLFQKSKQSNERGEALTEIINDASNTATADSPKSDRLRKVARDAVRTS